MEYIITFASGNHALKAELILKQSGWSPRLITAPRAISSQCGFCLLLASDEPELSAKLKQLSVSYIHIYTRQLINGVKHYAQQN